MSNITFNQGGYTKQSSTGVSDGMLFFNPQNRSISVDGDERLYFNDIFINDNQQANATSYTQSSDYIYSHKVQIDPNSQLYYGTTDANNIIGVKNVSGGYISNVLQQLNDGITYEATFDSSSQIVTKNEISYVRKIYTFDFPTNLPKDKTIKMLMIFVYSTANDDNITNASFFSCNNTMILNIDKQSDTTYTLEYPTATNGDINVFKAFWV